MHLDRPELLLLFMLVAAAPQEEDIAFFSTSLTWRLVTTNTAGKSPALLLVFVFEFVFLGVATNFTAALCARSSVTRLKRSDTSTLHFNFSVDLSSAALLPAARLVERQTLTEDDRVWQWISSQLQNFQRSLLRSMRWCARA
jgi:hypothetical protein